MFLITCLPSWSIPFANVLLDQIFLIKKFLVLSSQTNPGKFSSDKKNSQNNQEQIIPIKPRGNLKPPDSMMMTQGVGLVNTRMRTLKVQARDSVEWRTENVVHIGTQKILEHSLLECNEHES